MGKSENGLIAGIIIILIGSAVGVYLEQTGYFTSADIRPVRNSFSDDFCPLYLENFGEFNIEFSNQNGNRGADLYVELSSPNNISFLKAKDYLSIPAGKTSQFTFRINPESLKKPNDWRPMDEVTINIFANYTANRQGDIKSIAEKCYYKSSGSQLLLIK